MGRHDRRRRRASKANRRKPASGKQRSAVRVVVARAWRPLLLLAIAAVAIRLLVGDGDPTSVRGTIERFSSIEFRSGSGEDANLREHGIDPDAEASTVEAVDEADLGNQSAEVVEVEVGVSPTCGCQAASAEHWRGVTFASREILLERTGRSPLTEWLVAPSSPDPIQLDNSEPRVFPVDVFRFKTGAELDPERDRAGSFASLRLPIVSSSPPTIRSAADVPLAAWIPLPGSDVAIERDTDPQFRNPVVRLTETYPDSVGRASATSFGGYLQGYPLGEFLMPSAIAFRGGGTAIPGAIEPADDDETTIVVPRDAYAFRVAAIPLDIDEHAGFLAKVRDADFLATPIGPLTGKNAWLGNGDGGRVVVTVRDPLTGSDYDEVRDTAASSPLREFTVLQLPDKIQAIDPPGPGRLEGISEFRREKQDFAYPPMPPTGGMNIFGEMRRLVLKGAIGAVSVGGKTTTMQIPSELEMRNISRLGSVDDRELIPFLIGDDQSETLFDFSAVAEVFVDGESQASFWRRHNSLIVNAIAAISLLASIVGLLDFWLRRRGR